MPAIPSGRTTTPRRTRTRAAGTPRRPGRPRTTAGTRQPAPAKRDTQLRAVRPSITSSATVPEAADTASEVVKNTKALRVWLAKNMLKVANGEQPVRVANAVCGYAQQVYNTMNVEMKMAKAHRMLGKGAVQPVALGD